MNEQGSKKILFNSSMLMSLKAELLKKQEEVQEKKRLPQHKLENFKPSAKSKDESDKSKIVKRSFKDNLKAVDTDELEACRKAKAALEKKAELYDHLSDRAGTSQLSSRFLVDFNTKKQEEYGKEDNYEVSESFKPDDEQVLSEEDSEWLDFTDCLGRTRKCHRSDIELYKKRDLQLFKGMSTEQKQANDLEETVEETHTEIEKPELVQKTNDYLQTLREKWEQKERELQNKDSDIHYQDVLFDEARMHGVGYYSFSTDEKERQKQMEELTRQRQETIKAQQEAEEKRKKRDELMAARVAAARARQRLRAGLPPEDPVSEPKKEFNELLLEFLNKHKKEADATAKEKEKKIKEEEEKRKQELREAYVREWDMGKEGMEEKTKRFKEMTQEEYVELQRSKRINEFAPPSSSFSTKKDNSNSTFDRDGNSITPNRAITNKTWSDVRPKAKTPPTPIISDLINDSPSKGLYFTSARTPKETSVKPKYKNFVKSQETTLIVNELSEDEETVNIKHEKRKLDSSHTEIAPPPTYDYYGPVPKQSRSTKPFYSDITEAYAQGTKSLESECRTKQLNKDYDFMFD